MQAQVAAHLNLEVSQVLRVEEWPHVLFAVIAGRGGRFVSKKVLEMQKEYTAYEVAEAIANLINESDSIYQAKVWNKLEGEVRVYVSYPSRRKRTDCGFVRVCDSGSIYCKLTLQAGEIEALYASAKSMKIGAAKTEEIVTVPEALAVGQTIERNGCQYRVVSVEARHFDDDGYEVSEHDYAEICSTRYESKLVAA